MKKTKTDFKSYFSKYSKVSLIFVVIFIIATGLFTALFSVLDNRLFIYILVAIDVLDLIAFMFYLHYVNKKTVKMVTKDLYETSARNYDRFINRQNEMELYTSNGIEEMQLLNSKIKHVNEELSSSVLLAHSPDYSKIPLEFSSKEKNIVEHDSFVRYFDRIISDSLSYRNVLIQAYYELEPSQKLWDFERNELYESLHKIFRGYPFKLYSPNSRMSGYYVYLPQIDSLSNVIEIVSSLVSTCSIMRENEHGSLAHYPLHFAIVCYPYSNIDEMFTDIDFAVRMGKLVNTYFPVRTTNLTDLSKLTRHEAMNLNYMSKLLSGFASLDISVKSADAWKESKLLLSQLISYLNIDQAGLIALEDSTKNYNVIFQEGNTDFGYSINQVIPNEYALSINEIKDDDNSYHSSNRNHLSAKIAEVNDRLGIQSCFYYAVKGDLGQLRAIIYFINNKHDMEFDTYIRETLLLISSKFTDFYLSQLRKTRISEEERISSSLLKLSDFAMYKINHKTYQLTSFSEGVFDALHGKVQLGDYCYKALYGKESPCEKCPLRTGKKMKSTLDPWSIETTLTLNDTNSDSEDKILLIKRNQGKDIEVDDPYDTNLLVNSYYTFIQSIKNEYLLNGRGYILLLKFDNQIELISKFGSEPYTQAVRSFATKICEFETISNVYFYKPDTLAILLPDYGQIDAVNECEAIYDLNKVSFFEDKTTTFKITFLPSNYPQGYPTHGDFLRHLESFYFSKKYETNKNFIYFDEINYSRPASANEFMLSVIDEKFNNKDFTVNLQPLINVSNRKIFGAELLLRLSDEYRKITFNTDKLIKVAAKNGKISLISSALLDYVKELYEQYGATVFRMYGFERVTINTDYSYLSDTTLLDQIHDLYSSVHFNENFLCFEITEKDIYEHYSDMKKFISEITKAGVTIVCDRYNGEYLTFERLKELGINEIKIDRDYTRFIDTDKAKYNMIRSILESSKESNIRVGLIGVENMEQYKIISEISSDCYLQGYAFFKPLEKTALVEAIRKTNTVIRTNKN